MLRRDESDGNYNAGDPHEVWYRFGGKQMGYTGNNGTIDTDYQTSINDRTRSPSTSNGAFRFGSTYGSAYADFDLSVDPINSYDQGGSGGSYTARTGDTLASVAANLWGDSSLWYKLAEANGISGSGTLSEGQRLTIPAGVMKNTHNAGTFKPYDPGEVVGDTSPTTPQPQKAKKNKCGVLGQIILVAVAVAVSAITYGALTGPATGLLGAIGAGAVSGAAGSIASQGLGVATGIQDKFSWKAVGMAAIGGAVGGGLGKFAQLAKAGEITGNLGKVGTFLSGSGFVSNAVRGALSSAVTQGIGVATGLQNKFDFAGVAAAGIGAGVSSQVARGLGVSPNHVAAGVVRNGAFYANQAVAGMAGAIANAAARSLADGTDFGDNIIAALPDVIGSTLGNMIADPVVAGIAEAKQRAAEKRARSEHEAFLARMAAIGDARETRETTERSFGGARLILAGGQPEFGEPDPFQEERDRYSLEGVLGALGRGISNGIGNLADQVIEGAQDLFTYGFEAGLYAQIELIKRWPGTTPLATSILDLFVSDSPNRVMVFDSRTPEGAAAWQELRTTGPSEYFESYLNNALQALAEKSGSQQINGAWVLREGVSVSGVRASNLLTPVNRGLGTNFARGAFLDYGDLTNGAQLGDVVGTMTSNMSARVENNMVIFEAYNATTLTSAAYGNITGGALEPLMNMPTSGRYSPVIQRFRLELPMSQIRNAVYRPRR